jgi:hypothetical protein
MGKRELMLIAGFVLFGTLVYQFTKTEAAPGQRRFSFTRLVDAVRREVRGRPARAELVSTSTQPLKPTISELRINIQQARINIIGEERTDIASELTATSDGVDEAEAQSLVKEVKLVLDAAADTVAATIRFPDPGTQRATLVLRVPSHLRVRVEPNNGRLEIQHVASAEVMNSRGETVVKDIVDRLSIIHRGGDLTIEDVGSLRLETRGSDIKLARVRGDANLRLQAGDLRAEAIAGPLEIDSNDCDVMLEKLGDIKGVMRVNAVSGQISIRDLRSEARIDGRGAEIDVRLDRPTTLSIYNSNEPIELTLPAGGIEIDAVATDGQITLAPGLQSQVKVSGEPDKDQTATGKVNGGGPTITVRATRGDIRLMSASTEPPS